MLGEIALFTGWTPPPRGWVFCHGQELSINAHQALFQILGVYYGGDGHVTFRLPDLRGRVAIGAGEGYRVGQTGGQESLRLTQEQLPPHTHGVEFTTTPVRLKVSTANQPYGALSRSPKGRYLAPGRPPSGGALKMYAPDGEALYPTEIGQAATSQVVGRGEEIPLRQPFLTMEYIIAVEGIFPTLE